MLLYLRIAYVILTILNYTNGNNANASAKPVQAAELTDGGVGQRQQVVPLQSTGGPARIWQRSIHGDHVTGDQIEAIHEEELLCLRPLVVGHVHRRAILAVLPHRRVVVGVQCI